MKVTRLTALPPSGGAGAANVSRQTSRRALRTTVDPDRIKASFADSDPARELPYSPPILKGRILR
jgi:hypothetical protein